MVYVRLDDIIKALESAKTEVSDVEVLMTYERTERGIEVIIETDETEGDAELSNALCAVIEEAQVREYASRYGIPEEALRQFIAARAF